MQLGRSATQHMTVFRESRFGFENRFFGLNRKSMVEMEEVTRPTYVVIGIFRRGHTNPRERVVFVPKAEHLFRNLRWGTFRLRGVTGTLLSLQHVTAFWLYKCDAKNGVYERVELDRDGLVDL